MNKPEQRFYQLIKGHLPGDVSRVENIADSGTPDITGAYKGKDYWIELKISTNIYKIVSPEKLLRPAQIVWHTRRGKHYSIIIVLTQYPKTIAMHRYVDKEYMMIKEFAKCNNKWPWAEFERYLIYEIKG